MSSLRATRDPQAILADLMQSKSPKLLPTLRAAIRLRHFSPRTEEAYVGWVVRFVRYHGLTPPSELTERDVLAFLTHLAVERRVAPSTLAQALAALAFLYREILRTPLAGLGQIPQIKGPERLPVVLTPAEVRRVLGQLGGPDVAHRHAVVWWWPAAPRCLTLRVKDVDFERGELRIRRGKGAKDRVTMLPQRCPRRLGPPDGPGQGAPYAGPGGWRGLGRAARGSRPEIPQCGAVALLAVGVSGAQAVCGPGDRSALPAPSPRDRGPAGDDRSGSAERDREAGQLSYSTPLLRDPPAGAGVRHSDGAGTARASGRVDHDDLYPCLEPGAGGVRSPADLLAPDAGVAD